MEELSKTCGVLVQKQIWEISASIGFYYDKYFGVRYSFYKLNV